jgi:heme-degrading monooxygenase HmoA
MLADTPAPPYCAVIFTSQRTPDDDEGYAAMAQLMDKLAREQPGFLGVESARNAAGLGITVAYWRSAADAAQWKQHVDHLAAQKLGREKWYRAYRVRICEVQREYGYSVV